MNMRMLLPTTGVNIVRKRCKGCTYYFIYISTPELDPFSRFAIPSLEHIGKLMIMCCKESSAFDILEEMIECRICDRYPRMECSTPTDPICESVSLSVATSHI
jgi:hypothetical protein